jgi:integrase
MGTLLPQGPTDRDANRLKKLRDCARRLTEAHGHVVLADIDETWLFSRRRRAPRNRHLEHLARDRVSACFTLLRRLVHAVQHKAGQPAAKAKLAPRVRRAIGDPAERKLAPWPDLELLIESGPPRIRAALVLQLHVAARPGRVLALRVGDVSLGEGVVTVRVRDRAGRASTLRYPLTPQAVRALRPWHRVRRRKAGDNGLLFPMRGQSHRPTRSLNRAIRRAAATKGGAPVTMAAVRLRAQAALRAASAPRGMVRGTGGVDPALQTRIHGRLQAAWEESYGTPREHVPLRAPARCKPNQPEVGRRPKRRERPDGLEPTPLVSRDAGITPTTTEEEHAVGTMWPEVEELSRLLDGMAPPTRVVYVPAPAVSRQARPQVDLTHALAFALGLSTREVVRLVVTLVKARAGESSAAEVLGRLAAAVGAPVPEPREGAGATELSEGPWGWDDSPDPPRERDRDGFPAVDLLRGLHR